MAAVTVNNTPTRHVIGDIVVRFFNVSGASGSTLNTGMNNILFVAVQQSNGNGTASVITSFSVAQGVPSLSPGGAVVTFTSSGAMANEIVAVYARQG